MLYVVAMQMLNFAETAYMALLAETDRLIGGIKISNDAILVLFYFLTAKVYADKREKCIKYTKKL